MEVITAVAAWALASAGQSIREAQHWVGKIKPRAAIDVEELVERLSSSASIYLPGSDEFERASTRWSNLELPGIDVVVVPGSGEDVAETVKFANEKDVPFLAYNGAHGAITTIGKLEHGIEIFLERLSSVNISEHGKTATVGGGTNAKALIDELWDVGKQTVTGTCECVSYIGPALGGGHGWLQGHHGLMSDQFVSMDIVLGDGTLKTVDEDSDLWWAMQGAGHNFGIVTSVTSKIYDIEHRDWAIETLIFSGDKIEKLYSAANDHLLKRGTQDVEVINWSYWLNDPEADPEKPVIVFYIIQEGVKAVDKRYTKPFHDIGPLQVHPQSGNYKDVSAWTGIALGAPPCQKDGLVNPRFPIYLDSYNTSALKHAYDVYAAAIAGSSPFNFSLFMFEGYSLQGVKAVDIKSTAFAHRDQNLLAAPLITYKPDGPKRDAEAAELGNQLRNILHEATGRKTLKAYVNYGYGSETTAEWYGSDDWRRKRLRKLKTKYDPKGQFSFYAPID